MYKLSRGNNRIKQGYTHKFPKYLRINQRIRVGGQYSQELGKRSHRNLNRNSEPDSEKPGKTLQLNNERKGTKKLINNKKLPSS